MSNWISLQCFTCSGHGIIDSYYHNPEECDLCNGTGIVYQSKKGALAKYPGGPFIGRLTKEELAKNSVIV